MKQRAYIDDKKIEMIKFLHANGIKRDKICEITDVGYKTVQRIVTGTRDKYLAEQHARKEAAKQKEQQKKTEAVQTVIETQTETKAETVAQSNTISDEALYNVMKNAVLDAMNQALAQNMSNLRGMVLGAIRTSQM